MTRNEFLNKNVNPVKFWLIVAGSLIVTWTLNLITFIQTVVAEDFVWSEIGVFTIIQGAAILMWPMALVTGPMSLFM